MEYNYKKIISDITCDVLDNNIDLRFSKDEKIEYENSKLNGWFDDTEKELHIATGKPIKDWIYILAHEYSHFKQWKKQTFAWTEVVRIEEKYKDFNFDDWLNGKDYSKRTVGKWVRATQILELECEKMTAALIHKYNLNIDQKYFIKKANSYIYLYSIILNIRKWSNTKSPHEVQEILDIMPDKFLDDYKDPPKGYKKLVLEHCI